jgi:predicted ATPase/transcriptional regulator with XRE-family HTH domain
LAEHSGVSLRSISDFERGVPHAPRRDTVGLLADALGLKPDDRAAFIAAARRLRAGEPNAPERPLAPPAYSDDMAPPASGRALPLPPTPLLGRDAALADVASRLTSAEARLLTLTGPAGVGKTRLALEVAVRLAGCFSGGSRFVPLASVQDPGLVLPTIAGALELVEESHHSRSLVEALAAHLSERELLLVLDNCEHVLGAAADVARLVAACPRLRVLATSRAPLRVRGEAEWPLAPLALPSLRGPRDAVERSPAVALFVARARAVRPDFALDDANAAAVAEVCARLDGLPLAIELAAPLVRLFPPAALAARLVHPLPALADGARDLPDRQQSLRAAIAGSHDLLRPEQRRLFRRLAAFAGGFTVEAAEAVVGEGEVLRDLLALAEHSLIRGDETGPEPRFGMLETIRAYAAEQLAASGEEATVRGRHAAYFLAVAERARPELHGPDQRTWLEQLDRDDDNLRAALGWALGADDREVALRLAAAVAPFWWKRGNVVEGLRWLDQVLAREGGPDALRARVLNEAGTIARHRRELPRAAAWHEEALKLARRIGSAREVVMALTGLGSVALVRAEIATAEGYYRAALEPARREGLAWEVAAALYNLGNSIGYRDPSEAAGYAEEALAAFREIGERQGAARASLNLAHLALIRGEVAAARARAEDVLAVERELSDRVGMFETLSLLALIAEAEGDDEGALAYGHECLALGSESYFAPPITAVLSVAAGCARRRGQVAAAARLLGAADAWQERFGGPSYPYEEVLRDRERAAIREALGADAFEAEWFAGRTLTPEVALAACAPLEKREKSADPRSAD